MIPSLLMKKWLSNRSRSDGATSTKNASQMASNTKSKKNSPRMDTKILSGCQEKEVACWSNASGDMHWNCGTVGANWLPTETTQCQTSNVPSSNQPCATFTWISITFHRIHDRSCLHNHLRISAIAWKQHFLPGAHRYKKYTHNAKRRLPKLLLLLTNLRMTIYIYSYTTQVNPILFQISLLVAHACTCHQQSPYCLVACNCIKFSKKRKAVEGSSVRLLIISWHPTQ